MSNSTSCNPLESPWVLGERGRLYEKEVDERVKSSYGM